MSKRIATGVSAPKRAMRLAGLALVWTSAVWTASPAAQERVLMDSKNLASTPAAVDPAEAVTLIHHAARYLRQAALQREVASWSQERFLLEYARTDLDRAIPGLGGVQRARALRLSADLDSAMQRISAQMGRFVSPIHDAYEAPPPGRNELAILAKEGLALLHDEALDRPPNTDDFAWAQGGPLPAPRPAEKPARSLAARDAMSSVPGETVAWPQVKFVVRP